MPDLQPLTQEELDTHLGAMYLGKTPDWPTVSHIIHSALHYLARVEELQRERDELKEDLAHARGEGRRNALTQARAREAKLVSTFLPVLAAAVHHPKCNVEEGDPGPCHRCAALRALNASLASSSLAATEPEPR